MSALSIAEVLEKAASLIEPEGAWLQGAYSNGLSIANSTCWCIEGAVAKVLRFENGFSAEMWCDENLSPLALGELNAAAWNDAPERTQAEVVAKLREAAAKARGQ